MSSDLPPGFSTFDDLLREAKARMGFVERVRFEITRLRVRAVLFWIRRRR